MGLFGIRTKKEKLIQELNRQVAEANTFVEQLNKNKDLPAISTNLLLKPGEEAFIQSETTLYESRATSYHQGSSSGGRVRIAKGFSVGGSTYSGRSESKQELKAIDRGQLTLTNKRLLFNGLHETRSFNLEKILSIDPKKDSILVSVEGRTKRMYYSVSNGIIWFYIMQILKQVSNPHKLDKIDLSINIK